MKFVYLFKKAYREFVEKNLPIKKKEFPSMKRSQHLNMIYKDVIIL